MDLLKLKEIVESLIENQRLLDEEEITPPLLVEIVADINLSLMYLIKESMSYKDEECADDLYS